MKCFYIKESAENNKVKLKYKYLFNKLEVKENNIELPITSKQKLSNRKIIKIVQKLRENNVRLVSLSNELNKQKQLKNEMYSNNIDILDGRFLFKALSINILEYICKKTNIDIKALEISILVNDLNALNRSIIIDIAKKVKTLNIITNNIKEFKSIEDFLYDEEGIVIKVSNNKKKSLLKSKVILNLDFPEEDINLYNLPSKSILINTSFPIKIKTKKFNGININNYNIIIPNKYKMPEFRDEVVYESIIYNMNIDECKKRILEDKILVRNLIGEKGIIQDCEFTKL